VAMLAFENYLASSGGDISAKSTKDPMYGAVTTRWDFNAHLRPITALYYWRFSRRNMRKILAFHRWPVEAAGVVAHFPSAVRCRSAELCCTVARPRRIIRTEKRQTTTYKTREHSWLIS
jgi:hypothetical protein